jgi:Arc/MetJ-type ribon-helix-helix transcriptional regulator
MTIRLKPELEALIQKDVERGPYQSADEFVEQAVQMLHDAAKIDAGYASAERGELFDPEQARARVDERKRAWQSENKR